MSINVAEWICFFSFCASRITSFLLLIFSNLPRRDLPEPPPGPHRFCWKYLFQWSKLRETPPRIWQMLAWIDIPVIVNTFLLQHVQISMRRLCYINVFQWNRECFFIRYVRLNSRFILMTMGFSVICWFCRLRHSRFALKFSTEIITPHGRFPPWSGHSEFEVSSWQFCFTICCWEFWIHHLFVWSILLLRWFFEKNIWCIQLFRIFQVCYHLLSKVPLDQPERLLVILACQLDEFLPDLSVK